MNRSRLLLDAVIAVLLFAGTDWVFRNSPGLPQACDSTYSLIVAEKMLTVHSADLSDTIPSDPTVRCCMHGYVQATDLPYQFVRHGNPPAVYYGYPLGSTILSLPFVQHFVTGRGLTLLRPDGTPNLDTEGPFQQRIASRVSAAIVAMFYIIARFFCSPFVAALLALGFGLGSPVWSTLTRALWSHTWMVFWLSAAIVLLLIARRREPTFLSDSLLGLGLGTALFLMTFTRPHAVLSAGPIGVYLLLNHRRILAATVAAGAAWSAGLVAISFAEFGTPLPPTVYQPDPIDGSDVLNRFAWLMVSPSRGLLVFCPYLAVIAGLLFSYRHRLRDAGLLLPALLSVAVYSVVFAAYSGWHAGSSFGPRYFSDVFPWFILTGAMGVGAMLNATANFTLRKGTETALLICTFVLAILVHGRGATVPETWEWNYLAQTAGDEAAVKDWQHPQFLAGITFRVRPDGAVEELR